MGFSFTADELIERGYWDNYCKITGLSVWAYNEGQVDEDEVFYLTDNEAIYLGLMEGELPVGWPPEDYPVARGPNDPDPIKDIVTASGGASGGFISATELHLNPKDFEKMRDAVEEAIHEGEMHPKNHMAVDLGLVQDPSSE